MDSRSKFDNLARKLNDLRDYALHRQDEIARLYPGLPEDLDVRLMAIRKLCVAIDTPMLVFASTRDLLCQEAWWQSRNIPVAPDHRDRFLSNIVDYCKVSCFQVSFSALESTFRLLLRAIDPVSAKGSRDNFANIYACLINTHLKLTNRTSAIELLRFMSLLRNTIHNNGRFFPEKPGDRTSQYRGQSYEFKDDQNIDFMSWDLLILLVSDMVDLLSEILRSPLIASVPGTIEDPAAYLK